MNPQQNRIANQARQKPVIADQLSMQEKANARKEPALVAQKANGEPVKTPCYPAKKSVMAKTTTAMVKSTTTSKHQPVPKAKGLVQAQCKPAVVPKVGKPVKMQFTKSNIKRTKPKKPLPIVTAKMTIAMVQSTKIAIAPMDKPRLAMEDLLEPKAKAPAKKAPSAVKMASGNPVRAK